MRAKRLFIVSIVPPRGATIEEMNRYVEVAVRSFCGGMDPQEPMFDLDKSTVNVQHIKQQLLR
jgi:hypothetical protein